MEKRKKEWNSREKHEDDEDEEGGGQNNLGAEKGKLSVYMYLTVQSTVYIYIHINIYLN